MSDNSQGHGPRYCWKRPPGDRELSPLRAQVHELIENAPGQVLPLDDIYNGLPTPATSPARQAAVRTALKDLNNRDLVDIVWACNPTDPGYRTRQQQMLKFLQQNSDTEDPPGVNDVWCSLDTIRASIGTNVPIERDRMDLDALIPTCVKSNGLSGDDALYTPVKG